MGHRRIAIAGIALTAGVATCAGVATGVLPGGAGNLVGGADGLLRPATAAADELPAFSGCEQLRRWYVRSALPKVGPWGLGGPPVIYLHPTAGPGAPASQARPAGPSGQAGQSRGPSATGTNVQEADVDESDVAKTDGRIVVRVSGRALVVTDVSGSSARQLSRTPIDTPSLMAPEVLLRDHRVIVVGEEPTPSFGEPVLQRDDVVRPMPPSRTQKARTRLLSYDLSEPSAPRLVEDRTMDGSLVATREYADGSVRVVLTHGYPLLHFVQPDAGHSPAQATAENRRILRAAPISSWLPTTTARIPSQQGGRLFGCADVRHPLHPSGIGTVSVTTFPFGRPDDSSTTAITTSGDLVYSSADRLYVATANGASTAVHAFTLAGGRTSYLGSGTVPGTMKDRWSLSEHDGHLRVATTRSTGARDTVVTVLSERGDRLVRSGAVGGLGNGEDLKAVRWFGDLAVVVTFRQTDPLYTVDLADPARPRVLGRLEAPGFSSYLHPLGDDLLLGLGQDATARGALLGAQAATFDLAAVGTRTGRDPAAGQRVRRLDTMRLGGNTALTVETDPRALTYLPDERLLVTSLETWGGTARSRFVALRVAPDGGLRGVASWPERGFGGPGPRALPLGGGRLALVDSSVRVVRVGDAA